MCMAPSAHFLPDSSRLLHETVVYLLYLLSGIPSNEHTTIYLFVDGHLDCLRLGAVAVNILVYDFGWIGGPVSVRCTPRIGIAGSWVGMCLILLPDSFPK